MRRKPKFKVGQVVFNAFTQEMLQIGECRKRPGTKHWEYRPVLMWTPERYLRVLSKLEQGKPAP